jgi:hypothetical protein
MYIGRLVFHSFPTHQLGLYKGEGPKKLTVSLA